MELMYPIAMVLVIVFLIISFFVKQKNSKYTSGKKVANTQFVKETEYYQKKIKIYKRISRCILFLSVICILASSILIARPVTIVNKSEDKYNRDIFLGLDISTSENEVNLELVKKFRKILPSIDGDRIGIVLFNTAPVTFCPLTDDLNYVDDCLEKIEKVLEDNIKIESTINYTDDAFTLLFGGVIANSGERGSSLIGDGLAGTLLAFPDLKDDKERTRIIIFATDNDLAGDETITLEEACKLCKNYQINLYAYCPTEDMNQYVTKQKISTYQSAVEKTAGGKFYIGDLQTNLSKIMNEIKETKTSLLKTSKKTIITDHPEVFLIVILGSYMILIVIEKRIKLW